MPGFVIVVASEITEDGIVGALEITDAADDGERAADAAAVPDGAAACPKEC